MNNNLPPRKRRAILALLEHGAVSKAADTVGVSRQALHRWMKEPEFIIALNEASTNQISEATHRLTYLLMQAVDELEYILSSGSAREKLRAAELIITHGMKLREITDIEERISRLEQSVHRNMER